MTTGPILDPVTHTYSKDGQPYVAVSRVLEALKLTPPFPEGDPKGLKDFGSAIHKATELAAWDKLDATRTSQPVSREASK